MRDKAKTEQRDRPDGTGDRYGFLVETTGRRLINVAVDEILTYCRSGGPSLAEFEALHIATGIALRLSQNQAAGANQLD